MGERQAPRKQGQTAHSVLRSRSHCDGSTSCRRPLTLRRLGLRFLLLSACCPKVATTCTRLYSQASFFPCLGCLALLLPRTSSCPLLHDIACDFTCLRAVCILCCTYLALPSKQSNTSWSRGSPSHGTMVQMDISCSLAVT